MLFSQVAKKLGILLVLSMTGMLLLGIIIALLFHYEDAITDKENRIAKEFLDKYYGRLKEPTLSLDQAEFSSNFIVVKEFHSAAFSADSNSLMFQIGPDVDLDDQRTIRYVLFISPEIYQSRSYISTIRSGRNSDGQGTKDIKTYRLKVWIFDEKSSTLVGYKEFLPQPLRQRYYNDDPEVAAHNDVREWINVISRTEISTN